MDRVRGSWTLGIVCKGFGSLRSPSSQSSAGLPTSTPKLDWLGPNLTERLGRNKDLSPHTVLISMQMLRMSLDLSSSDTSFSVSLINSLKFKEGKVEEMERSLK